MVPEKKAREWCASKGDIPYFETSAKEVHNVDTAFLCIAKLALEHEHDQDILICGSNIDMDLLGEALIRSIPGMMSSSIKLAHRILSAFPFILVGNKIDLDDGSKQMVGFPECASFLIYIDSKYHAVSLPTRRKAREWCASKGDIPYFETSAKEDHNVDTAFLCMARLALEHEHDQDM
ncbi:Ras-related protein Rab7 [Zea mays]|uniref:Ras-related protein Rab7 n=1 Tax=Zea mays TaxID=4577 RepID=A0A317YGY6_MAIZE|nr:Ras-related protein Rab7 [Zea mays]